MQSKLHIDISEIDNLVDYQKEAESWHDFTGRPDVDVGVMCNPVPVRHTLDFKQGSKLVFVSVSTTERIAILPFKLNQRVLPLSSGLVRCGAVSLWILHLPDFKFPLCYSQDRLSILFEALAEIRKRVKCDVILIPNCVLDESGLGGIRAAGYLPLRQLVVRNLQPTYLVELPDSFDSYVSGLARTTRQNYRWKVSRMRRKCGADLTMKRYSTPGDMEVLYPLMMQVWERSWKGKLSTYAPAGLLFLREMAKHGWIRSYVLFVGDAPVAYVQGIQHKGRYLRERSAYNNDWRRFSAGGVLTWLIMEDLFEHDRPDIIDFDCGYNEYKQELGSKSEFRGEFWVPVSFRGRAFMRGRALINGFHGSIKSILQRLHLMKILKKRFQGRT